MRLRRLAACLVSISMLQLGMVRAEPCAAHTDTAATSGDASHHGDHGTAPDTAPESGCDVPSGAGCCSAVASCSLTLSTPEAVSNDVPMLAHVAVLAASRAAPLSATAAPETPPPRV